jgi:hypothetical protein
MRDDQSLLLGPQLRIVANVFGRIVDTHVLLLARTDTARLLIAEFAFAHTEGSDGSGGHYCGTLLLQSTGF